MEISEKGQLLAIYLHKTHSDSTDFSISFSAAVMKMRPNLTNMHFRSFVESCDGIFRETPSGNIYEVKHKAGELFWLNSQVMDLHDS